MQTLLLLFFFFFADISVCTLSIQYSPHHPRPQINFSRRNLFISIGHKYSIGIWYLKILIFTTNSEIR